jgi:hypothetical protein
MIREPLIIVGAGFNLDANAHSREPFEKMSPGRQVGLTHETSPAAWEFESYRYCYPNVEELRQICFGPETDRSVTTEELFEKAYAEHDHFVLKRLTDLLLGADHYIADTIIQNATSPYFSFLNAMNQAQFVSYNYDGFLELLLLRTKRWTPHDGFGVKAEVFVPTGISSSERDTAKPTSMTTVLHLHGSLYLYPVESRVDRDPGQALALLRMLEEPRFLFDPDCNTQHFSPFCSSGAAHGYELPQQRFVPPLSNKSGSLEERYYKILRGRAMDLVGASSSLLSIGYSFADSDRLSHDEILEKSFGAGKSLTIIDPQAETIAVRLRSDYGKYKPNIDSRNETFAEWVGQGLPGEYT